MTLMLASVADAEAAAIAARAGADILDFADADALAAAAAALGDAVEISATLSGPDPATLLARGRALAAAGARRLHLILDAQSLGRLAEPLAALARDLRLVGVLYADADPDFALIPRLGALGFAGVTIAARDAGAGRLFSHIDVPRLAAFSARCRAHGLAAGVGGALEPPDAPRLLLAAPHILGFAGLDAGGLSVVRALIPRERRDAAAALAEAPDETLDRVFVRDFVVEAEIGAYRFERGRRQRVAFDVEARIRRAAPHDMRAIFSYDVILDAIRLVVAQGHHAFVEEVAEAVAALALANGRVRKVRVSVRKLDVIEGEVGVEISRP